MSSSSGGGRSPSEVRLRWSGKDLVFEGGKPGGPQITTDSGGSAGPSPTQLLLLSLAGCMAVDVRMILDKSRVPVDDLEVVVDGDRRETEPRKFVALRLVYRVTGPGPEHQKKLERAVALSRDKYCSVLHSLDPGIDVDVRIEGV